MKLSDFLVDDSFLTVASVNGKLYIDKKYKSVINMNDIHNVLEFIYENGEEDQAEECSGDCSQKPFVSP